MGLSSSLDLRSRVVAFGEAEHSRRGAARHFGGSESFAITLPIEWRTPDRRCRPGKGLRRAMGRLKPHAGFLVSVVERQMDITKPELSVLLEQAHGITADPAVLSRFLCRRGFTHKKC